MKLKELLPTINGFIHVKSSDNVDIFIFQNGEDALKGLDSKLLNRKVDYVESSISEKDDVGGIEVYLVPVD